MNIPHNVLPLLKAKGWNLYKGIPGADFPAIIAQGRATTIEHGAFYHVLPVAFRDSSLEEVVDHLAYARHTNQLPVYNDRSNPPAVVRGIVATDTGIAIIPDDEGVHGIPLSGYEFDDARVDTAITLNISNYNIHYFANIDEIATFVARNKITPQTPSPLPGQLRWTFAHHAEDSAEVSIYPNAPSPFLFRGQLKRYEPCYPTIARDWTNFSREVGHLTQHEQASLILGLVRTQWFIECLRETPLLQWMKEKKLHMDETAVAQHYGLPTGYIDLSQSFDVASFFACCKYDKVRGAWAAATSGDGVIYVVDQRMIPIGHGPKPICLQPLPRPSEQWGWVHEVTLGDDFDNLPYVKKLIFRHSENSSRRILDKFHEGGDLFPPDPMAVIADRIMQAQEVPSAVARKSIDDLIEDPQGFPGRSFDDVVTMIKREMSVSVVDRSVTIIDDQTRNEIARGWAQRRDAFFQGIGFRVVRTIRDSSTP